MYMLGGSFIKARIGTNEMASKSFLKMKILQHLSAVTIVFLLIGCTPPLRAAASRSLIITGTNRTSKRIPAGTSGWNTLGSYRLEGRITLNSASTGQQPVFRFDTDFGVLLDSTGNIFALLRGGGSGGGFCALNGAREIRFRLRRNISVAKYSFEVWNEATGSYCGTEQTDPNPTVYNLSGDFFAVGSIYDPLSPEMDVAFIRVYSDPGTFSKNPPPRIATTPGDLLNLEFENSLQDTSGKGLHLAFTSGGAQYRDTAVLAPRMQITAPLTVRAGDPARLEASGYNNDDTPGLSISWVRQDGPANGLWTDKTESSISFTPTLAGEYSMRAVGITAAGLSVSSDFKLGAVLTDSNGVVVVPDAGISQLLGPMIRHGANPWNWHDDRAIVAAQYQMDQLYGTNGAPGFWSNAPWQTNLSGTLTLVKGSATISGTGTQFQRDFCGAVGNTSPTQPAAHIYIKYNSEEYPGTQGLARYMVVRCDSQTSMTVNAAWGHANGTQAGILYARADETVAGWWNISSTPGNYYDNVLAFYTLYYRTGLTKYRDAARTLARNWWYGPFYDRGKNYDTTALGGTFIAAGPARGQSITGVILWALETGENIWTGMNYVLAYQKLVGYDFAVSRNWVVQIGDLREQGYLTAAYALAARYHPDGSTRTQYRNILKQYINQFWAPLQLPSGEWRNTSVQNALYAGSSYVTVNNGSNIITLTGSTWSAGIFCVGNCGADAYKAGVWFFSARNSTEMPGKTNADIGGDTTFYRVTNVTSPTTATLDRPYAGSSGNKGAIVSSIVGFGTQPFMMALTAGVFGTYVYDTLQFYGDTEEANKARQFTIDGVKWLATEPAYNPSGRYIYGASTFLNCVGNPSSLGCEGDSVLNGEGTRGLAAAYLFTRSDLTRSHGDDMYSAVWCKPTGGWKCAEPGFIGNYGFYIDDPPTGFMLNRTSPLTNKWFGFFFGYGFSSSWPAARVGGLQPAQQKTASVQPDFMAVPNTSLIRVTSLYPDGSFSQGDCTNSPCTINVTANRGNPIIRYEYFNDEDRLLEIGEWFSLPVD
jgi:hypothetical protein